MGRIARSARGDHALFRHLSRAAPDAGSGANTADRQPRSHRAGEARSARAREGVDRRRCAGRPGGPARIHPVDVGRGGRPDRDGAAAARSWRRRRPARQRRHLRADAGVRQRLRRCRSRADRPWRQRRRRPRRRHRAAARRRARPCRHRRAARAGRRARRAAASGVQRRPRRRRPAASRPRRAGKRHRRTRHDPADVGGAQRRPRHACSCCSRAAPIHSCATRRARACSSGPSAPRKPAGTSSCSSPIAALRARPRARKRPTRHRRSRRALRALETTLARVPPASAAIRAGTAARRHRRWRSCVLCPANWPAESPEDYRGNLATEVSALEAALRAGDAGSARGHRPGAWPKTSRSSSNTAPAAAASSVAR